MDNKLIGAAILFWVISAVLSTVLFCTAYKEKNEKRFYIAEALVFLLMFFLLPIAMISENDFLFGAFVTLPWGLFLLLIMWQQIHRIHKCNFEIVAKCTGYRECKVYRGGYTYAPEFEYRYQGALYKEVCIQSYPMSKFEKLFVRGKQYSVLINPNDPKRCIDKRNVIPKDLLFCGIVGVIFVMLSILCFVTAI